MEFKQREVQDVVIVEFSGELMGGPDASAFKQQLYNLVDQGKTKVIADLSNVDRMNSSGLGILISGLTTLRNNHGDLKLVGATEKIENLLIITKLIKIFDSFKTVDEAIRSFS